VAKSYWEDFTPGHTASYGPRLVTREEIVAFAAEFDPQTMHLDEDAARAGMLGGLAASGWHSCALLMRIASDGFLLQSMFMGGTGIEKSAGMDRYGRAIASRCARPCWRRGSRPAGHN
jgi:acyl dehydratase